MKLYLIYQSENNSYDTYDSAVVAALDEWEAARTHPSDTYDFHDDNNGWYYLKHSSSPCEERVYERVFGTWAKTFSGVTVEYLGEAAEGTPAGVICASFNAG